MRIPPLLAYSVLRLLAFAVPLAIMWLFFPVMRDLWWLAAIFAALIGMSISILFLRRPLSEASAKIHQKRTASARSSVREEDAAAEDAVTGAADPDAADTTVSQQQRTAD